MPPDRANPAADWQFGQLLALLFRQFRRPLTTQNIDLTDAEIDALVKAIVERAPMSEQAGRIREALVALIAESEGVLARWNLTFEQALDTGMDSIPGWETTAEFLDLANEKSNAELRISTGAALAAALGDLRYARYLTFLAARDDGDLDSVLAKRVLQFASGEE